MICIHGDDTGVIALLEYWVNRAALQCKLQMERWAGSVLDINAICADLVQKCLQLLFKHALSSCDTTFYTYGKGNVTALNNMVSGIYQCLAIIGGIDTTQTELMNAAMPSFVSLWSTTSNIHGIYLPQYIHKKNRKKRNPKVMALHPTSANLLQHMFCAHLQIMLWKAADCEGTAGESRDITKFGWYFQIKIYIPVIAECHPAPSGLQCRARSVLQRFEDATSSTPFCNYHGGQDSLNLFTATRKFPNNLKRTL